MLIHEIRRVRHETRRRSLIVTDVDYISPRMARVSFRSEDLKDFESASADDHIKLFFPAAQGDVAEAKRDFTPRRFDPANGSLVIDFALHDSGPATQWAANAKVGDPLDIGGPRGSTIIADDFDWYLLIGDETALPAMGRRIESAAAGARVFMLAVVEDADEIQTFKSQAEISPVWVLRKTAGRDDAASVLAALANLALPAGDGFVWIAAEAGVARMLRDHFRVERAHPNTWLKASGYWKRGEAAAHERLGD